MKRGKIYRTASGKHARIQERPASKLDPVRKAYREETSDLPFHGRERDSEGVRDLFVELPARNEPENLALTPRQEGHVPNGAAWPLREGD